MHELLKPVPRDRSQGIDACRTYLRGRWKARRLSGANAWRAWPAFGPREQNAERIALGAFFSIIEELDGNEFEARRGQTTLLEELRRVDAGDPCTPIGLALVPALQRLELPIGLLRRPLLARDRARHVHAFATRSELHLHATELAYPEARAWLRSFGPTTERDEILVGALGLGLQLTHWLATFRVDFEAGRLHLPMEELHRFDVSLDDLRGPATQNLRRLLAAQATEARALLSKGWPLCDVLSPARGRLLAFFLRWQAATLSALEHRRFEPSLSAPPAGVLRLLACFATAARTRRAPF